MEQQLKLFMVMLGCKPFGRITEQHDIFFGIGTNLKSLIPHIDAFWPECLGNIHIDAWREVTMVDNYTIEVVAKSQDSKEENKLFFINLGGYKPNEFEEYHYKILTVATTLAAATKQSKQSAFYKHCGFKGAISHVDDKFGIDLDDIYNVNDLLLPSTTNQYSLKFTPSKKDEDQLHIGYLNLAKLRKVL